MRWEYMIVPEPESIGCMDWKSYFDSFGAEGWELVTLTSIGLIFKRIIPMNKRRD